MITFAIISAQSAVHGYVIIDIIFKLRIFNIKVIKICISLKTDYDVVQ